MLASPVRSQNEEEDSEHEVVDVGVHVVEDLEVAGWDGAEEVVKAPKKKN